MGTGKQAPTDTSRRIVHDGVSLFPSRYKWLLFGWCMAALGLAALVLSGRE